MMQVRRWVVVGLLFGLGAGVTSACSSSASPDATGGTDGGGTDVAAGDSGWSSGECGRCLADACKPQREVCNVEPSCAAHLACADACAAGPDGRVAAACLAACPGGDNAVASRSRKAYDGCITDPAPAACAACPKPPNTTDPILAQKCPASAETNTCFKCEDEKCCDTFAACDANPDCRKAIQPCIVACAGNTTCVDGCYKDHPQGLVAWAPRQACLLARCRADCGAKPDTCVDCVIDKCAQTFTRCYADVDCFLITECNARCNVVDDACIASCKKDRPMASQQLLDDYLNCGGRNCLAECQE